MNYRKASLILTYILYSLFTIGQTNPPNDEGNGSYIFISEKLPKFPGGADSLKLFVIENLRWPAPDFCGEGFVVVQFTVETNGVISNIKILKSLTSQCDTEVIRLIKSMPDWIPPLENGKPQKTCINFPVRFK